MKTIRIVKLLTYVMILTILWVGTSNVADATTWVDAKTGVKLGTGGSTTIAGYTVKAIDFSDTEVVLTVERDGILIDSDVLKAGQELICDDDSFRIHVDKVDPNYSTVERGGTTLRTGRNPYAIIDVYTPGYPKLSVSTASSASSFLSGDGKTSFSITIKNKGESAADDVVVRISTELEQTSGDDEYKYDVVKKGSTVKITGIEYEIPDVDETCTKIINVTVEYTDHDDVVKSITTSRTMSITRPFKLIVTKSVTDRCYLGESVYCTIVTRNAGDYDANDITLTDSLPSGVELAGNWTEETTFDLSIGESHVIKYQMKPCSVGTYTVPAAVIKYSDRAGNPASISTGTSIVYVDGSDVHVDRGVVVRNGVATVTTIIKNTGNVGFKIYMTDVLSEDVNVTGDLHVTSYLAAGESYTSVYEFPIKLRDRVTCTGKIKYTDLNSRTKTVRSDYTVTGTSDTDEHTERIDISPTLDQFQSSEPVNQVQSVPVPTQTESSGSGSSFTALITIGLIIGGVLWLMYRR